MDFANNELIFLAGVDDSAFQYHGGTLAVSGARHGIRSIWMSALGYSQGEFIAWCLVTEVAPISRSARPRAS